MRQLILIFILSLSLDNFGQDNSEVYYKPVFGLSLGCGKSLFFELGPQITFIKKKNFEAKTNILVGSTIFGSTESENPATSSLSNELIFCPRINKFGLEIGEAISGRNTFDKLYYTNVYGIIGLRYFVKYPEERQRLSIGAGWYPLLYATHDWRTNNIAPFYINLNIDIF